MENTEDVTSRDSNLATHSKETCDIEIVVEKRQEAITLSCTKSFNIRRKGKEYDNAKIGSMVDTGTHQKEKTERPKKTLPENEK